MVLVVSEPEMLERLIDGLKKAAGSAHQLAHAQENPRWLQIRDRLEIMVMACVEMASAKAMPRQQVLNELNVRAANAPKDINGN